MAANQTKLNTNAYISETWNGGYKLEIDLTAQSQAKNWQFDFDFPHTIREVYGVQLTDHGNGNYSFSGQDYNQNLAAKESTKAIFIIDDSSNQPLVPQFQPSFAPTTSTTETTSNPDSKVVDIEQEEKMTIPETSENNSVDLADNVDIPDNQDIINPQPGSGQFNYGEALQKSFLFFEANRSGVLPKDNRIEWRGNSATNDGSDVGRDLTGGYYDAGDHVKFGLPMASNNTMLAWGGIEYELAYKRAGQWDELLEAVKWGTDYFLKAHVTEGGKTKELYVQVGDGNLDHKYWGSPEAMTMARPAFKIDASKPGSDVAAQTASALASASILFRSTDQAYADKLLKNAEQLFEFAETYQAKYSDSIPQANPFYTSVNGYWDELTEAAAWLNKATGEQEYLNKAESFFNNHIVGLGDWTWAADDKSYAAAVLLAQQSDNPRYKNEVEKWIDRWVNGEGAIEYTQGGLAFRTRWGSLALSASASYLTELYNDTVKQDGRYGNFATSQIDYILGDNPRNSSYMIGFGENYPQQPHHRGASGNAPYGQPAEHILYGAVVGGPGSVDDFDYNDDRNDWVTNEVGTGYNAPLTSALIQQYDNFGGDPLTESELDALVGIDADGTGF